MPKWEEQILEILSRKEKEELEEFKAKLRQAGRLAPCRHIALELVNTATAICTRGKEPDCLTCPDYEPEETPGHWSQGYAQFECGKVIHLVDDVESDGYWRSGITLCGRWLNEEDDAVEIYPLGSFEELLGNLSHDQISQNICKKCYKVFRGDNAS